MRQPIAGVVHAEIVEREIDLAALLAMVQHRGIGAVSLFVGIVRDVNEERQVSGMEYDAYVPMAAAQLSAIASEACAKEPDLVVAVEHRIGTLKVGEASVAIACAHPHRREAISAAGEIIEALKKRVPVWKLEHYIDGSRQWIDPTASAQAATNA